MKKIFKIIIFITVGFSLLITIIMIIFRNQQKKEILLFDPGVTSTEVFPSLSPLPVIIQYDSSTDLGKELESIDPKVLDSDFNE